MASDADAWIEDEPRLSESAAVVLARARRRLLRTFMFGVPLALILLGIRVTRPPLYTATLYFVLTEGGARDSMTTTLPPQTISNYLQSVALSQSRLLGIMKKYDLSPALRARDPVSAVEAVREDIDIDVTRNYFAYPVQGEPRTAEVTISYTGGDPERVRNVLHDIGGLVLSEQAAQRHAYLESARVVVNSMLEMIHSQLNRAQVDLTHVVAAQVRSGLAAFGPSGQTAVLEIESKGLLARAIQLETRLAQLDILGEAETQLLGLNFKLIDEGVQVSLPRLGKGSIVVLATLLLVVTLGVGMIVIGAFDRRVYAVPDLGGFAVFGVLPSFPGFDVASFRKRTAQGSGRIR